MSKSKAAATAKPKAAVVATPAGDQQVVVTGKVLAPEPDPLASPPDDTKRTFPGYDEIQQYAHLLNLGPDAFDEMINDLESPTGLAENKIYGLLALERNGQNRTPYVKAMMKRLDLKVSDLPGGGPGYTNDVHPISEL